ncbi:nuclear factor erythroid 2-related factor 3 [Pteronotus mesoamericanus]|uniref:nuclear factor erythroid 2-related factor 3 n=1 Tax=Pteronotus mesoamericanus TaxID=1884717 RepID=UPI0023EC2FE1|nr:nuclear factor erythroid 2-related factor 3 [Pteronotus parnellii mesoamericanus]
MKYLKPWWSESGGLLHLTILLSLAGLHLDLDLDLYLLFSPPTFLGDDLLLGDCQTSPAYAPSLFSASGGRGRTDHLHPKGREPDPAAEPEGQLFWEVRTLGVPFIPRTRVDAWLVHSVAAGDTDGAHGLLGAAAASSAGGVGASADGGNQAAPGAGGDPRAAPSSPLEEEEAPAEPTAQVPDACGHASEENEVLRAVGHSSQQEENEQRVSSAQKEKSLHQKNEDENKRAEKPEWEAEKTTEPRNERHLNGNDTSFSLEDLLCLLSSQPENSLERHLYGSHTSFSLEDLLHWLSSQPESSLERHLNGNDTSFSLEDLLHLLSSQPENSLERHLYGTNTSFSLEDLLQLLSSQPESSLEDISLGDIPPLPGSINDGMNSSAHYNVNFSQAISHDVNLHEAMLLCPDNTFRRDLVERTSQPQEPFLQLNSHTANPEQTLPRTNLTGFLPPVDHQIRNLTSQDFLNDLDMNMFDEINSVSLAAGGFDPLEVSHLFKEPDSDSGLSLNSSHNSSSVTKSNSTCEGAIGSSSDLESLSHCDLEGAVGGYYPEPSKTCPMDLRGDSGFDQDLAFQHILHNHTYHLQPSVPESTSESFSWPEKSHKMSRYLNDTDTHLSRDERRAKALHIPFSIDEIVHMPVDSFNSMLSSHYLTDLQVSLIRDIRRRGKNKVAAQNCRKRKLDIILNLEDDVCNLKAKKETLKRERAQCNKAINIMKQKLHDLYHDIFSRLRDEEGRPVNPNEYALQCSHDGSVWIIPKELVTSSHKKETQKGKRKSERRN